MNRIAMMTMAAAAVMLSQSPQALAFNCTINPQLCGLPVNSTVEQADLDAAIDVVLVGDGFVDMPQWQSAAANAVARFKEQTATGIYQPNLYNFHVVDVVSATTDIGDADLTDTALGGRSAAILTVDMGKANLAALNAPDVDVVVVILNGGGRANANFPIQAASGGSMRLSTDPNPISHEMGHALIRLADEYVESGACRNPTEAAIADLRNVTATAGCAKFSTTAGAQCHEGGQYCGTGVWRSYSSCLMRASGNAATCPVCARAIAETLTGRMSGADVTEPWVAVNSPANGATVSGRVTFSATTFDLWNGPTRVSFVVDGVMVGAAQVVGTGGTASIMYDVGRLSTGSHALTVFADDQAGHAIQGVGITFVTAATAPPGDLVVTLTSPVAGASLPKFVYASGSLTGGRARWVALEVDGVPVSIQTDVTSFINLSWDGAAALGPHTLQLRASNDVGATFVSGTVSVTVTDGGGGQGGGVGGEGGGGPYVGLQAPAPWQGVGNRLLVKVGTDGFQRPAQVVLKLDGVELSAATMPTLTTASQTESAAFVDSSAWPLGVHQLEATVTDGVKSNTSQPVAINRVPQSTTPQAFLFLEPNRSPSSGTVTVRVASVDSGETAPIRLFMDNVLLATVPGPTGQHTINTTSLTPTFHVLVAVATDGAGNSGRSQDLYMQVDNTPPVVTITSPLPGQQVLPGVVPVSVQATDSGSGVARRELRVNGVLVQESTYQAMFAVLEPGTHRLTVKVYDSAGLSGDSQEVSVVVGSCSSLGCNDGNTCTVDTCHPSGLCVRTTTPGCCQAPADCEDGDPCTSHACNSGSCTTQNTAGCCAYGFVCVDGNPATQDVCATPGGACTNPPYFSCTAAAQCDDADSCSTDSCLAAGQCFRPRSPGCCITAADCNDGRSCTTDTCNSGTCSNQPTANCCDTAADCDDGVRCTQDECLGSTCVHTAQPNCCLTGADCANNNPCQTMACSPTNTCVTTPTAGCCTFGFECNDYSTCTTDTCNAGTCAFNNSGACCVTVADCTGGNACTTPSCDSRTGLCTYTPNPGCCLQDADCADAEVCTQDRCQDNACVHTPVSTCCHNAGECPNTNPCLSMACTDNTCVGSPISGCCATAADCGDGNVCTTDTCQDGTCQFAPVAGCCNVSPDCADTDVCTVDTCVEHVCANTAQPSCCNTASQCTDGDTCTSDSCTGNACVFSALPGCCRADGECSDGNACTQDRCTGAACFHDAVPGCCTVAADCADTNTCTTDSCLDNVCVHQPVTGCCSIDADCDDGNVCTTDSCNTGTCQRVAISGCGADAGRADAANPPADAGNADAQTRADAAQADGGLPVGDAGRADAATNPDAAVRTDAGARDGATSMADASADSGMVVGADASTANPPADGNDDGGPPWKCACAQPGETLPMGMGALLAVLWTGSRRRR